MYQGNKLKNCPKCGTEEGLINCPVCHNPVTRYLRSLKLGDAWKVWLDLAQMCECTNPDRGLFTWREDPDWWSCAQCDGRVKPKTVEELNNGLVNPKE